MARLASILIAALLAAAPVGARDLTGAITLRERLALPPGTSLLIEVMPQEGPFPTQETIPDGQPPYAFTARADEGPVILLAGIRAPDGRRWLADPLHVPSGTTDIGLLVAHAWDEGGFGDVFACGETLVQLGFRDDEAIVTRSRPEGPHETRRLPRAGSGRFASGETHIDTHGDRVVTTWDGEVLPGCTRFPWPTRAEVTARGNEPGWVMTTSLSGTVLSMETGLRIAARNQIAYLSGDTIRAMAPGLPDLILSPGPCRDTMTGMPYPAHALLMLPDGELRGCAGEPGDLFEGSWRVTAVQGAAPPEGVEVTLDIDRDSINGHGGCNRYTGSLSLTGEGLALGPVAATRMACPPAQMQAEGAFLAALATIDRFDIAEDGSLILLAADQVAIVAAPRHD